MRKQYDFSQAARNPYAKRLKSQITIRLDTDTLAYFRSLATDTGIPYQVLINMYLRDCVEAGLRPNVTWAGAAAERRARYTTRARGKGES